MTEDEIRITMAEFEGWIAPDKSWGKPPNYLADLNAVRRVEEKLEYELEWHGEEHHVDALDAYVGHLDRIVARDTGRDYPAERDVFLATAAQRCEAILRATGKWS